MENFETFARPYIDSDAYDVVQKFPFVAEYKTPNSYAAKGFTVSARFLAYEFAIALAAELGNGWKPKTWTEGDSHISEFAELKNGNLTISVRTKGWGANAYSKVELTGFYQCPNRSRDNSGTVKIGVTSKKDIATIARDVTRRILPPLAEIATKAQDAAAAKDATAARLTKKAAQLVKRYPNLKIHANVENERITIATKWGPGVNLDSYVYENSQNGKWRLTGTSGYTFGIDDIDSKAGRAILKLINGN